MSTDANEAQARGGEADLIWTLGSIESGARVLDLACGHGRIANRLADIAELAETDAFDVVINWFTAFGYFEDAENRRVLAAIHRSLRPGGRILLELNHGPARWANFLPSSVSRRGEDRMIDEHRYEALTRRMHTQRTVMRSGEIRSFQYSTRIFTFPELQGWLQGAGLDQVEGFGPDGAPLAHQARRMIVRGIR